MIMILSCSVGTFCGVFRRQALDRGAILMKVDRIVTGTFVNDKIVTGK